MLVKEQRPNKIPELIAHLVPKYIPDIPEAVPNI